MGDLERVFERLNLFGGGELERLLEREILVGGGDLERENVVGGDVWPS